MEVRQKARFELVKPDYPPRCFNQQANFLKQQSTTRMHLEFQELLKLTYILSLQIKYICLLSIPTIHSLLKTNQPLSEQEHRVHAHCLHTSHTHLHATDQLACNKLTQQLIAVIFFLFSPWSSQKFCQSYQKFEHGIGNNR